MKEGGGGRGREGGSRRSEEAQLKFVLSAGEVPKVRPVGDPEGGRGPQVTAAETPRQRPGGGAAALHKVLNSSAKAESQFWKLRAKLKPPLWHHCRCWRGIGQ